MPAPSESYTQGAPKFGTRLYRRIMDEGLATSCRHCHMNAAATRAEMKVAFGSAPQAFFLEKTDQGLRLAAASRPELQPGPGCSDAPLVQRLRERHSEWRGDRPQPLIGMPLTLPPLARDLIDDIRRWTSTGCQTPDGPLCEPCS